MRRRSPFPPPLMLVLGAQQTPSCTSPSSLHRQCNLNSQTSFKEQIAEFAGETWNCNKYSALSFPALLPESTGFFSLKGGRKITGRIKESIPSNYVLSWIFPQTSPLNISHQITCSLRHPANFYTFLIFVWYLLSQDPNVAQQPNQKRHTFTFTWETWERATCSLCLLDLSWCCPTPPEPVPASSHSLNPESSVVPHWL